MSEAGVSRNWHRLFLTACLAVAAPVASAALCDSRSVSWQAARLIDLSEWDEFDAAGRKLVHESGPLQGAELSVGLHCTAWHVQAQISQLDGERAYDGQTSTGVPAVSLSAISVFQGHMQVGLPVTDAWTIATRLSGQTLRRDIASTATASGYPERYDWTLLSLGAQWQTALGPGTFNLAVWSGSQLQSRMWINLPGFDPAVLPLGSINQLELTAGWRTRLSQEWHFQADVRHVSTDISQGADVVVTRGGVPAGVAHQPRTNMTDTQLAIRVGYEF